MQLTLPKTGYLITLFDFVSQDLHEKIEQLGADALGLDLGTAQAARNMTVEQIGEALGTDRMMEIQNAGSDDQRDVLLEEARKEIMASKLELGKSIGGAHKIDRARTAGMIDKVEKDGQEVTVDDLQAWVGKLPRPDFKALSEAAEKIFDEQAQEMGKSSAQQNAS